MRGLPCTLKNRRMLMSEKLPNMDYDADEVIGDFKSKFKWPKKMRLKL